VILLAVLPCVVKALLAICFILCPAPIARPSVVFSLIRSVLLTVASIVITHIVGPGFLEPFAVTHLVVAVSLTDLLAVASTIFAVVCTPLLASIVSIGHYCIIATF